MSRARVVLVASPDDYFLEVGWKAARDALAEALPGAEVEELPAGTLVADVVMALQSPSLFSPHRILVVPDGDRWIGKPQKRKGKKTDRPQEEDPAPLVALIEGGLPEGTALLVAAQVPSRPSGPLAEAVERTGELHWLPLPEPPKPWQEGALSADQRKVLERLLREAAGGARFTRDAVGLLLERLGFAPRDLVGEVGKLAAAAGGGTVDEALVRRLVFPAERSLDIVLVLDAFEHGELGPVLGLIVAFEQGTVVRDWRGKRVDETGLALGLIGNVGRLLRQMLYLRKIAAEEGLMRDLDPAVNGQRRWYPGRFKKELGPMLVERIVSDPGSPFPLRSASAKPSVWHLGRVFRAAGRFPEPALVRTLGRLKEAERLSRGRTAKLEAVTAWLAELAGSLARFRD